MARIRQRLSYSKTHYKNVRHGAVEDALWDEDELVDHRPSHRKARKRSAGCPANDGKSHVYVRENVKVKYWLTWQQRWWEYSYDRKVCCGCEHESPRSRRYHW